MGTSGKQIEFLARAIANRLEDRGLVEFGDAEAGIQTVAKTLEEHFRAIDVIENEARHRLGRAHGDREPSESDLMEEMRRVAAERNVTL
jgi:predicted kinase